VLPKKQGKSSQPSIKYGRTTMAMFIGHLMPYSALLTDLYELTMLAG
jgi:hypothetical protein